MSTMLPPDAPPQGPPPDMGGGAPGGGLPPELMAALSQGGGPGGDPGAMPPPGPGPEMPMDGGGGPILTEGPGAGQPEDAALPASTEMSPIDHIRQAIEHLKEAFNLDDDDVRGSQTAGSLASLQKILGGEQTKDKTLSSALNA